MHRKSITTAAVFMLLTVYILLGLSYQSPGVTVCEITSASVPAQLDGYKIVHITDFHSGLYNVSAADVVKVTAEQHPDIICLTGDIVDGRTQDYEPVEELISGLSKIAPIYAVHGNNEYYDPSITVKMGEIFRRYGVQSIDGKTTNIFFDDTALTISGIADAGEASASLEREALALKYSLGREGYSIILYHRANEFDKVASSGYDLVLSGHLHGGIIRLPFLGGVLSPDGDYFPKYSGGLYQSGGTFLVSNRGSGNNHFMPRFYNQPEVVLVVLRTVEAEELPPGKR